MKIFQKLKKWIAGLTAALLLVSILAPTLVSAEVAADTVTVVPKITNDQTPSLSGTMSSLTDLVSVTVNGVTYAAANNHDGTWDLTDDTIPVASALLEGPYDVTVNTSSGATVTQVDGLVIDLTAPLLTEVLPIAKFTNLEKPVYQFSSSETGSVGYLGSCGEGDLTTVTDGNNAVAFGPYTKTDEGFYGNCQITVTDLAGNSSSLEMSPFTIDMTAPIVKTTAEFFAQIQPGGLNPAVATERLNDGGVYVVEASKDVTVTTDWELQSPATDGSARTYKVVYRVTDAAGNITESTPIVVELKAPVDEMVGNLPVTLVPGDVLGQEQGTAYSDQGAVVKDWTTETIHVWTFGNLDTNKVGQYTLGYKAREDVVDPLVPLSYEARSVNIVDTTGPGAVTKLNAFSGNGYVQLSWVNPSADDLAGLKVYRSTTAGQRGTVIAAALAAETLSFDDYTVVNGETYYYTLVAYDAEGNNSLGSNQVTANPKAPKVAVAAVSYYDDSQKNVVDSQEIKSDETQNKVAVEDESSVPVIGIIILVLLIVLGIYLLYLQNPEWFNWVFFWKRKRAKVKVKIKKK